tara:strand:+ start:3878 stop:4906 length:1029 start_codon:yes stop_codon:yes gene_type:complete
MNVVLKRYLRLVLLLALLSVPVFVTVTLVLSPGLRYQAFRVISEAPGIVTFFTLRRDVVTRDFSSAGATLERQLGWSKSYDVDQSVQVPALIENTAFAMQAAALDSERQALAPFLRKLADSYPQLYRPQMWLGQALATASPAEALNSLKRAAELMSTDEMIYRAAIQAAARLDDSDLVAQWCRRYRTATAGGSHPFQFNPLATGVGMRRVIAEIPGADETTNLIEYNALTPEAENILEFQMTEGAELSELMLHFATAPSVILTIREIVLLEKGLRTARISDGLVYQSQSGYVLDDNRVMLTGQFGDQLRIGWPKLGPVRADKALVFVDVTRAALTNLPGCHP